MAEKGRPAGASGGRRQGRNGGEHPFQTQHSTFGLCRQVLRLPNGRVVGEVRGDVFVKRVWGSRHMLQKPRAWAVDVAVLRQAEALGARAVEVHDLEDGTVYRAPLERFWQRGIRVNRGHGEQRGLLLADWQVNGAPSRADAVQLSLLEVAA
jgi:hypothetical protein